MKISNRKTPSTGASPARARASGRPRVGMKGQPQWLTEWIDSKPRYVLLKCGHKWNQVVRNTLVIEGIRNVFTKAEMFCDKCQSFQEIVKTLKMLEYHGIQPPIETDLPPF